MICAVKEETGSSIRRVCDVLNVPRSSFYHAAQKTPTQVSDAELGELIEEVFRIHRGRYGYRRVARELAKGGQVCAAARVRRIMAERGLKALPTGSPKAASPTRPTGYGPVISLTSARKGAGSISPSSSTFSPGGS